MEYFNLILVCLTIIIVGLIMRLPQDALETFSKRLMALSLLAATTFLALEAAPWLLDYLKK